MRCAIVLAVIVACGSPAHDDGGDDQSPRCGDGVIDPGEACDVHAPPQFCTDLGFHEGATACNADCTIDTSRCNGRCGDGVINGAEECDGAPPPGSSCLSFNADYGVVDCTTACVAEAAPTSCRRYGDVTLLSSPGRLAAVAANGRGAIALAGGVDQVALSWDGALSSRSGTGWTAVTATTEKLIGLSPAGYGYYDGAWHDVTIALGVNPAAATTSQGVMYVVSPDCSARRVTIANGASATLPTAPAATCTTPITVLDQLYVSAGAAGVLRWDGTAWTTVLATPATRIVRGLRGHLLAIGGEVLDVDVSQTPAATRALPLPADRPIASDIDGTVVSLAGQTLVGGLVVPLLLDPAQDAAVQGEDGAIILSGFGVWRFEPRPILTSTLFDDAADFDVLDDGGLAYCGGDVGWIAGASSGTTMTNHALGWCYSLVGDPRKRHAFIGDSNLWVWNGTNYQDFGGAHALAGDGTQLFWLYAQTILTEQGPVPLPAGCAANDIAGPPSALYAVGNCAGNTTGTIWKWNGSAFVSIASTPVVLERAWVLRDGTLFGQGPSNKLYRLDGTALIEVASGVDVFGASASDFWITLLTETTLLHVQGSLATEIRVPSKMFYFVTAEVTDQVLYGWDPNTRRIFVLPRDPLRLPGFGL